MSGTNVALLALVLAISFQTGHGFKCKTCMDQENGTLVACAADNEVEAECAPEIDGCMEAILSYAEEEGLRHETETYRSCVMPEDPKKISSDYPAPLRALIKDAPIFDHLKMVGCVTLRVDEAPDLKHTIEHIDTCFCAIENCNVECLCDESICANGGIRTAAAATVTVATAVLAAMMV